VIIADGANSLLAEKAKLRRAFNLHDMGLGVKEVMRLPSGEVEGRFGISGNEGVAYSFLGSATRGLLGGCFLYTNRESVSLGMIVSLSSLRQARVHPAELLDRFKEHPSIARLISGGIQKEYSAHLIPESGYHMVPKLYADGILVAGDAAGFTLNTGLVQRGMDFAIASGLASAETVKKAREVGDFSRKSLSYYEKLLEENFVLQDLKKFRRLPRLLREERIYREYPLWLNRVAKRAFNVGTSPQEKISKLLSREKPEGLNLFKVIRDIFWGWRNL